MAGARLRRIRYPSVDAPTLADFERLVDSGNIVVDRSGRARIEPHRSGRIFRVAVGVTGHPVGRTGRPSTRASSGSGSNLAASRAVTTCSSSRSTAGAALSSACMRRSQRALRSSRLTRPDPVAVGSRRAALLPSRRPRPCASTARSAHRADFRFLSTTSPRGRSSTAPSRPARRLPALGCTSSVSRGRLVRGRRRHRAGGPRTWSGGACTSRPETCRRTR